MGMPLLFVYGSLKRGYEYSDYLQGQVFLGDGILPGYELICLGDYPAVIPADFEASLVKGEVYAVSEDALALIDILEGDEYERTTVKIELLSQRVSSLVYVASNAVLQRKDYHRLGEDCWIGATS